ncbi:MAG: alpha/beta hydrolase [Rhodobacteraceae bacterium]|nr:alpha/beta hydrolase [Paracoccaceae bacterium]MBR9822976.1 alpha/beta hydrolase [Paracoccaceae bacterium]
MNETDIPRNCEWLIDGLVYRGLAWGPENGLPVLALHGWMDHGASFQTLAPLLAGCHVVAPDLSGQGLSDHRAAHATYNIWDDLPQIAALLDHLGWRDCILLGHSRGANIATLCAAALPERVRALIALESLVPEPEDPARFATTLRAFVEETRRQGARPPRRFASREDYIRRREAQGNARATATALAARALQDEGPGGVQMRGDPRMFASSAVRLSGAQLDSVLQSLACPVLNIWAAQGIRPRRPLIAGLIARADALVPDYETLELPGDHHVHLDPAGARQIADALLGFLGRKGLARGPASETREPGADAP